MMNMASVDTSGSYLQGSLSAHRFFIVTVLRFTTARLTHFMDLFLTIQLPLTGGPFPAAQNHVTNVLFCP